MSFCDCGSLLDMVTKTGTLTFKCPQCQNEYQSVPEDALIHRTGTTHNKINTNIIRNAPYIPSMPKVEQKCESCKATLVTFVRTETGKITYICKCGHYWS